MITEAPVLTWVDPVLSNGTYGYQTVYQAGIRKASATVAVYGHCAHKTLPLDAIHTEGLEKVDGHSWELFHVSLYNDTTVWGSMVEGLGMMHVMVPRDQVRDLSDAERTHFAGKYLTLSGMMSGIVSQVSQMPALPKTDLGGVREHTLLNFDHLFEGTSPAVKSFEYHFRDERIEAYIAFKVPHTLVPEDEYQTPISLLDKYHDADFKIEEVDSDGHDDYNYSVVLFEARTPEACRYLHEKITQTPFWF
jgi:hypothetical protein